jgi:hypothetical protein
MNQKYDVQETRFRKDSRGDALISFMIGMAEKADAT